MQKRRSHCWNKKPFIFLIVSCVFLWSLFGLIVAVARGKVNGKEKGEGVPLVVTGQAVCCFQPATSN